MILSRMTGLPVEDGQSGYRLVDATASGGSGRDPRGSDRDGDAVEGGPAGFALRDAPIRAIYGGTSHYRPFRDTWKISWGAVFIQVFELS